ncbi:MAG: exodeoxyribonuclease V subunit alpha [Actinomycetota bacterium]
MTSEALAPFAQFAPFAAAGVLADADVHVARRLARLGSEPDGAVLLAAALAVRAVRFGSVCVDLGRARELDPALPWPEPATWDVAVRSTGLVTVGAEDPPLDQVRPLRFVDDLLYLERYWRQEQVVARWVDAAADAAPGTAAGAIPGAIPGAAPDEGPRAAPDEGPGPALRTALDRLFGVSGPDNLQRRAVEMAATHRFSIIAGGPGTGKTWTVARLLATLQSQAGQSRAGGRLRVALAAPTGKAAARLTESIAAAAARPEFPAEDRSHVDGLKATTLHRLLGARPGTSRFTFNRTNRLPHDLVVLDEASMVSLTLMSRLMDALRPDCRLVLVGDPDQLASIEVGAVLGDLVARPGTPVVRLESVHRFSPEIHALARAIRAGDPDAAVSALHGKGIEFIPVDSASAGPPRLAGLRDDVVDAGRRIVEGARAGDGEATLAALSGHQVLCAHREGAYGVRQWGRRVEAWLRTAVEGYGREGSWYVGRPLLITQNDHQLRLYNGDVGVVVAHDGGIRAAFTRDGKPHLEIPGRLGALETVHALSIHRSQGSQYERVTVVLPPASSPLMTRELLYTAVTRAERHVRIIGTPEALAAAVRRPIVRASGLRVRA